MRLPSSLARSLLLLLGSLSPTLSTETKYSESLTLSYEHISSSKPSPLAVINYDPKSLRYSLKSWTPPSVESVRNSDTTSSPLLRILTPSGSSTVTTLSTFSSDLKQHINLYLSSTGTELLSASITSVQPVPLTEEEARYRKKVERAKARGKPIPPPPKPEKPKKPKKGASPPNVPTPPPKPFDDTPEGQPKVNFVQELPPPTPKLMSRAAPVVDEQGNEVQQPEQAEKTFFQKYWWVIVGALVLTMGVGGGDK